ncbi:MAG: PAS domain S-box protein [Rhodothermales bacterium]
MDLPYKAIFHHLPFSAIIVERKDPDVFVVLDVNVAAARTDGWEQAMSEEIIGRNLLDVFPEIRGTGLPAFYNQALDTGEPVNLEEIDYRDAEGDGGLFSVDLSPLSERHLLISYTDITQKKQAEAALRESESRLRSVMNHAPVVLWALDLEGVFTFSEGRGLKALGLEPGQVVGLSVYELYADYPEIVDTARRALQGESVAYTVEVGEVVYENRYTPFFDRQGRLVGTIGVAIDVTERKRAAEALHQLNVDLERRIEERVAELSKEITERRQAEESQRESEERFSKMFHASPNAIALTSFKDKRFIEVNEGFERMFGYTREEAIGKSSQELILWSDPEDWARLYSQLETQGEVREMEVQFRTRSGREGVAELSADVIEVDGERCILSIGRDITERKRPEAVLRRSQEELEQLVEARTAALSEANATLTQEVAERKRIEEALRESEEKHRTLFETMAQGVVYQNAEGVIISANSAAERILGLTLDQMQGRTSFDPRWRAVREDGSDFPGNTHPAMVALATGEAVGPGIMGVFNPQTDTYRWIVVHTVPQFKKGEDKPYLVYATFEDITERKQAEAERERLIEELEAKNTELEQFTYTVSHDLKSPLFTIKGFLGLLEQDVIRGDAERVKTEIEQINTAADKMQRLLDELLELSRIGRRTNPPEEMALADLAREAVELVAGQIAERGVEVEIDPALPVVVGDRVRLLQMVQNLVDNAVKFMGDQPQPCIEIGTRQDGDERICYVRDNGIGVEPRHHQKVFGLFERLNPRVEGTGIGLALARRIVEVHGGRIWVESEGKGHGATFCFTLPCLSIASPKDED